MNSAFKPLIVVFGMVVVMAGVAYWRANASHDHIPWQTDLAAAKAESARTKRPVLVYFTATWCPPCQRMKEETWPDPGVAEAVKGFIPVKLDVDDFRAEARQYDVRSIPRLQIIGPDGAAGRSAEGAMSAAELIQWLQGSLPP
jgi:thiol:disulfide interchange protein